MKRVRMAMMGFLALLAVAIAAPVFGEGSPVNVNTATAVELESINGIGPAKAKAIVEHRSENGSFASVEDLQAVPGIGERLVERLRPQVSVGQDTTKSE